MVGERQGQLLQKVISFEEAKQSKEQEQLQLFNTSEKYVSVEVVLNLSREMNRKCSTLQQAHKEILQELQGYNRRLDQSYEKNDRLVNTLEQLLPEMQNKVIDNVEPSLRVGILAPNQKADVAVVDGASVPSELVYTLLSSSIVDKIGKEKFTAPEMGRMLKALNIKGDPTFHNEFETGKKSRVQRYKPNVIQELYHRLKNYDEYGITQEESEKWQSYIKPESEVI